MTTLPIEAGDVEQLILELGVGQITLTAHDGPGVIGHVTGPNAEAFTVETDGRRLSVITPRRERRAHEISLAVPTGVGLKARTGRGDLISDVGLGEVEYRTGAGDTRLSEVGTISCSVGGGDVTIESIAGDRARITTGAGDVHLGRCEGSLQLRTGSGDVTVQDLRSAMRGVTGSGDLAIDRLEGSADVHSGSGYVNVGVAAGLPVWLDLKSGSGRVEVDLDDAEAPADGEPFAAVRARTGSGWIRIARTA